MQEMKSWPKSFGKLVKRCFRVSSQQKTRKGKQRISYKRNPDLNVMLFSHKDIWKSKVKKREKRSKSGHFSFLAPISFWATASNRMWRECTREEGKGIEKAQKRNDFRLKLETCDLFPGYDLIVCLEQQSPTYISLGNNMTEREREREKGRKRAVQQLDYTFFDFVSNFLLQGLLIVFHSHCFLLPFLVSRSLSLLLPVYSLSIGIFLASSRRREPLETELELSQETGLSFLTSYMGVKKINGLG